MIKILKNLKLRDWLLILLSSILIFMEVYFELKMPDYMQKITVLVESDGSSINDILKNGLYMLSCALTSLVLTIIVTYIIINISSNFSYNLREKIFKHSQEFGMEEIKRFKTSSLITRTTNDVTQLEMIMGMGLQLFIKSPMTAIYAIIKILNKNFDWSLVTFLSVIIILIFIIIFNMVVVPKFKTVQKLTDNVNNLIDEDLKGIRVVRAFNAEKYQENKFEKTNNDLTNIQLFIQKTFSLMSPLIYLVMNLLNLVIYFIGSYLIMNSSLVNRIDLFADMIVFSSYAMQVIMSFLMLAIVFMMLPRANVSAKRINEVLDTKSSIEDGNISESKNLGTIEFKNVSFKYPDAEDYILNNISFKANKGETIAFIGSTGSGKSTLINLIPRFYDVTDGEILIDNINVKDYKLKDLYNKIGYISQKPIIFNGTIKTNINFGESNKKIDEKDIINAAKLSESEEFINKLDNKYDEHVASSGTNISGGQKQRLSIARALARKSEIYIFDDSFSALDYKTDLKVRQNLKKYMSDSTVLIVAQRIGTIMNADKIIVLDNGKCVGIGKHKELLKTCEVYKEIALSQLSKEELENE